MQTTTIDTARLRTHCWVAGREDGEPLLMVHGNLVTGRFFQALAERVPDRFRVVAPDLRSFGRTAALPVDASRGLRDWSDDLRSLVEALGWADRGRVPRPAMPTPPAVVAARRRQTSCGGSPRAIPQRMSRCRARG